MRSLLDEEALQGPSAVRISYRPQRLGLPVPVGSPTAFVDAARQECQVWAGATTAIIPASTDGRVPSLYSDTLAGSTVDAVVGFEHDDMCDVHAAQIRWPVEAHTMGRQLAVAMLNYQEQGEYLPLQVVELDPDDPWRGVYAACLGLLPDRPDPKLLNDGALLPSLTFEDFLRVERVSVSGSLEDLLTRLSNTRIMTPRRLSTIHLAYGSGGSTGFRVADRVLPDPDFARRDAGPNVVVVCSGVEDHILLWNLRAAWGDTRAVPIGIPAAMLTPESIAKLVGHETLSRNGFAHRQLYVTSVSQDTTKLAEMIGETLTASVDVAPPERLLTFGPAAGWTRDEVLIWNDGESKFVALPPDSHRDVFTDYGLSPYVCMYVDIEVRDQPFPTADDVRIDALNYAFYAGSATRWGSARTRSEALQVVWPTRMTTARALAAARGLGLRESAPGRISRTALLGLVDLYEIGHLAHAPLLALLEELAGSVGVNWAKRRLADHADLGNATAPSADTLMECSFDKFKRALGNNTAATKAWLLWAERAGLIVKGFPLTCPTCGAKQWTPVVAFSPPIICRGCAGKMDTPFGDEPQVHFKYRLSERLRRVYEQDAIGHLLTLRYFYSLLGGSGNGRTIGVHPGMEVLRSGQTDPVGEADVLILMRDGAFVPVEVKRSMQGFRGRDVEKLDSLVAALGAPWSAVVACQYGMDGDPGFAGIERRDSEGVRSRVILSYDALLDPHPVWALGSDPFEWAPLSIEEIQKRESEFVDRLTSFDPNHRIDWFAEEMLRRPRGGAAV